MGFSLTREIVDSACCGLSENQDTEMMWYYLEMLPDLKTVTLPEASLDPLRVRLTLDYEEDYWLLMMVQRTLGGCAERSEIDELFRRNPDLYKLNWFRNAEWSECQLSKKP